MTQRENDISKVLAAVRAGDEHARSALFELVYEELRRIASREMRKERRGHTLQTTALVHEAYVNIMRRNYLENVEGRNEFFSVATQTMRRLLVDHARKRRAKKRGGESSRVLLDDALDQFEESNNVDFLDLDEALNELERMDTRQSEIIQLRFFCGLSVSDVADQIGVSKSSIEKDFATARAWLNIRLS